MRTLQTISIALATGLVSLAAAKGGVSANLRNTSGVSGGFSGFAPSSAAAHSKSKDSDGNITFRLTRSYFGYAFPGNVPDLLFGDIIPYPLATFEDENQNPVSLRRKPVDADDIDFLYLLPDEELTSTPQNFVTDENIIAEYYWSPHAKGYVIQPAEEGEEQQANEDEEGAEEVDGFAYASRAGTFPLFWRTADPISKTVNNEPVYGLFQTELSVASGARQEVRRMFWTEGSYRAPAVEIPSGEIEKVEVAYTDKFPEKVQDGENYVEEDYELQNPYGTLWLDSLPNINSLKAYNHEGRVLVEFLGEERNEDGLRHQVGVEVVDVIRAPIAGRVQVPLGERLYPLDPAGGMNQAYEFPDGSVKNSELIADNLALYTPQLPTTTQSISEQFSQVHQVEGRTAYFAQKETESPGDVQVYWLETGLAGLKWPHFLNRYDQFWPESLDSYALNLRPSDSTEGPNTLPIFGETATLIFQDDPTGQEASLSGGFEFQVDLTIDDRNRALMLFSSGESFWYMRVESVLDEKLTTDERYSDFFTDSVPDPDNPDSQSDLVAFVGERLTPPSAADSAAAWVDLSSGDAIDPTAYVNPFTAGIVQAAEQGVVIPVNAAAKKNGKVNNRLDVWWFEKVDAPARLRDEIEPVYFPSHFTRYQLKWPDSPIEKIVLASGEGTDDLDTLAAAGRIYTQNDPNEVGYNPNEEHAMLLAGTAYALRDDLNVDVSSDPYVLVRYTAADGRPEIEPYQVLREDGTYTFSYPAIAGTALQAPAPLPFMPQPLQDGTSKNKEVSVDPDNADSTPAMPNESFELPADYDAFTFEDRKGLKWVYRGPHDPESLDSNSPRPTLEMEFFYNTLPGFAFPNTTTGVDDAPEVGTIVPYLREGSEDNWVGEWDGDDALPITYTPYWPDEEALVNLSGLERDTTLPNLQLGETLVKTKSGLPGLDGATSVGILYDQATANTPDGEDPISSAVLHDPTRRKIYPFGPESELNSIPSSINTTSSQGRVYFQNLPPHLQTNFFFDPLIGTDGALVLQGEFKEEIVGDDYILLNTLPADDILTLKGLATDGLATDDSWDAAIDGLSTTLETFADKEVPGTYKPDPDLTRTFGVDELVEVLTEDAAVDSYALTAVGGGTGYLTLVLGNGEAFTDPSEPVTMQVISVGDTRYQGQVKPVTPANPLAESITLQHTADLAARTDDYEFDWRYSPPKPDGSSPGNNPDDPTSGSSWTNYDAADAGTRISFGGGDQPLLTLTDNYFVMRYSPIGEDEWSDWTEEVLVEGWIKRVLAGINPFNQRISDFFDNPINTDVSILTQAGTRWEGDVPLTLESVQDAGLIEIYESLLNRAESFTIDGTPAIDYGPANDVLLLAAGYLNDLYIALGNEAFADASNPLIALDVDPTRLLQQQSLPADIGTTIENTATARFAFEGQVPDLISEELTLLRGRDDFLVPGSQIAPVYNRFFWNFTRGIDAGEVIYAMNYNIRDDSGNDPDGIIDAADAARQYPQGHGDAYGHYLTALKNYYRLLSNANFTWTPRVEAVNILGAPVTVDYLDERKFAAAAVGLGRTASRIVELERRRLAVNSAGWQDLREAKTNDTTGITRHWGVEDWASRAGQGNYLHWVTANALLPEEDAVNKGIQKIDRQTVPELNEMVALGTEIQGQLDAANARSNALGLTANSMLFDLDPGGLAEGESHFDQILARAKAALANAATAHQRTVSNNNLLRSIENQADDYSFTVAEQENAFKNRLLALYGSPYPENMGPGRTYPQDYTGPDFYKFMQISRPYIYERESLFVTSGDDLDEDIREFKLPLRDQDYINLIQDFDNDTGTPKSLQEELPPEEIVYQINLNDGPYLIADDSLGRRAMHGSIQHSLQEVMAAEEALFVKLRSMQRAREAFKRTLDRFVGRIENNNEIVAEEAAFARLKHDAERVIRFADLRIRAEQLIRDVSKNTAEAIKEGLPQVGGTSNDFTFGARSAVLAASAGVQALADGAVIVIETQKNREAFELSLKQIDSSEAVRRLERDTELQNSIAALRSDYVSMFANVREIDAASIAYQRAVEAYQDRLADGDTLLAERETFRKRAAAVIQGARVRDVGFRAFRTESLEQYKILFDQAARYAWLAAQAYDYETGLLGTDEGADFMAKIVSTRALGLVGADGEPQFAGSGTGDPGLSSLLAQLEQDWGVAKGRLGINNPDEYGTLLSLRRELFEIDYAEDGTEPENGSAAETDLQAWKDRLRASLVDDIRTDPDIAAHALPLSNPDGFKQPGFVIEFSSTIESGLNFFGKTLRAGDSAFSSASFATKIKSVGVVFEGYNGMDPFASGGTGTTSHNDPNALSATPYVYLIPTGIEHMRMPVFDGSGEVPLRSWQVHDHAMPFPFDIGNSGTDDAAVWTGSSSLSEPFYLPRRHQPFRAVDDPTLFYGSVPAEFTNSRLIGRSVWNDRWKLVIPAETLLADPETGAEHFIETVKDIKLFLRTYSHAGN